MMHTLRCRILVSIPERWKKSTSTNYGLLSHSYLFFPQFYFFFSVYEFAKKKISLEIYIWGLQTEPAIEFQRQQVNDVSQEQMLDSGMEKQTYNLSFPAVSWNLISHYS
jgi:hypothetical protein